MTYKVATYFDNSTWGKYGLNWVRYAKSSKLPSLVVGVDLPPEVGAKVTDLGATFVPMVKKSGVGLDKYAALLKNIEGRCLFTQPDVLPRAGYSTGRDIFCGKESELACIDVVSPVKNIFERATTARVIYREVQKVHGLLSAKYILGTYDFWAAYVGFQNYLWDRGYLDQRPPYDELTFNFFMGTVGKPFSLETTGE